MTERSDVRARDFRALWLGQLVSETGARITRDGLPMLAVAMLGAAPIEMGLMAAMSSLSVVLVGMFGGLWVDRRRRLPILVGTDIARAALVAIVPIAAYTGRLSMALLYVVSLLSATLAVLFEIASRAYVPGLVGRERVFQANAKLEAANGTAEVVGASLTGALVQILTAPVAMILDAVSYLFSAASLLAIRTKEPAVDAAEAEERKPFWTEFFAGYVVVASDPVLRGSLVVSGLQRFFGGFFAANYVVYVMRDLTIKPVMLGFLIAAGGIGSLVAASTAIRVFRRLGVGRAILASIVLSTGATLLLVAPAHPGIGAIVAVFVAQLAGDYGHTIVGIGLTSVRQVSMPEHVLGRAMATVSTIEGFVGPLGALAGGMIASSTSSRTALFAAGLGFSLASLFVAMSAVRNATGPIGEEVDVGDEADVPPAADDAA